MRTSVLSFALVSLFTFGFFAKAGDTTGAIIECTGPAQESISLDYSYLNIKDHNLAVNIPNLNGDASLLRFWEDGNQLLISIRVDMPTETRFLNFASQSKRVDPRGRALFDGTTKVTDTADILKRNIVMTCKETDGGGSF